MKPYTKQDFDLEKIPVEKQLQLFKFIMVLITSLVFVLTISVLGIYLSIRFEDWTIFARSGAATILFALILAAIDHTKLGFSLFESIVLSAKESGKKEAFEKLKTQITHEFEKYDMKKSDKEIEYHTIKEMESIAIEGKKETANFLKSHLLKFELIISAYGTAVWGFGDLIGRVFT